MNRRKARVLALKILFQKEYRDIPEARLRPLAVLLDRQDQNRRESRLGGGPGGPVSGGGPGGVRPSESGGKISALSAVKRFAGGLQAEGRRSDNDRRIEGRATGGRRAKEAADAVLQQSRQSLSGGDGGGSGGGSGGPVEKKSGRERIDFAIKLVQGVENHKEALDGAIARAGENWTLERMALIDLNIMRIAVFEILFQPDIPGKTAVNEAVEAAKKFGAEDSPSFINGVLDKILQS